MKDVIIIDSTLPFVKKSLDFTLKDINSKGNTLDIIFNKIKDIKLDKIVLLPNCDDKNKDQIKSFCKENKISTWTAKNHVQNNANLYTALAQLVKEKSIDNVILFYIDSLLIDIEMLNKLYNMHVKNLAEYTFGDNFAPGLVPEILSNEFINKIKDYNYKKPDILSTKVFDCMDADINKFFIELEIAEYDFSLLRVDLTASSKRNFKLIINLLKHSDIYDKYTKYFKAIKDHPEILYIFPKYIEIEVTNNSNLTSITSPVLKMDRKKVDMDAVSYKKIIDELSRDYNDTVISFSLMGEPLMHPDFLDLVEYTLNNKIQTLIIETNGILLNADLIKKLSEYPLDKLVLLFKLDSIKEDTFSKLYNSDKETMQKIVNNIIEFINHNEHNKLRTFVQITKMKENNLEIEEFYKFWQTKGAGIIIQKYNHYLNAIEDKSVIDLTPLDRQPCWHLQRDMEIFSNGDVPVCKQDFNGKTVLGNVKDMSITDIFENQKKYFLLNYKGDFDKIDMCKNCDEWYTYNF